MIKDKLFYWALKKNIQRIPTSDRLTMTPIDIRFKLDFVKEPIVFPIHFDVPSWWKVITVVLQEVYHCLR